MQGILGVWGLQITNTRTLTWSKKIVTQITELWNKVETNVQGQGEVPLLKLGYDL